MRSIDDFTRPKEYISPLDEPLGKIIRDWVEKDVIPYRRLYDEDWLKHEYIVPPFNRLLGEYGLQRLLFPEDLGGWGLGHSDYAMTATYRMIEEMSRADAGMAVAFGVVFWPIMLITMEPHVNRRLCEEFAPMYCETNEACFSCLAMTEPQGGADIENVHIMKGKTINTIATLDGDEWIINGHKLWPTNTGGVCKLIGAVCNTKAGSTDPNDIALIFIPCDAPGVTQGTAYEKAGMAADKNGDVWFDNVRVPAWYRAHGPGLDAKYFNEVVAIGNGVGSTAFNSGQLLGVFEILQDFVNKKTFKGRPLKEHDAVAGVLGDFATTLLALRTCGYQAARMMDRPDLYGPRYSDEQLAKARAWKYFCADQFVNIMERVMQIFDTFGADRDWDIEKHWRDGKIVQLWLGGKQLGQMEVARWFFDCETL